MPSTSVDNGFSVDPAALERLAGKSAMRKKRPGTLSFIIFFYGSPQARPVGTG
jgi:hypothetical protein